MLLLKLLGKIELFIHERIKDVNKAVIFEEHLGPVGFQGFFAFLLRILYRLCISFLYLFFFSSLSLRSRFSLIQLFLFLNLLSLLLCSMSSNDDLLSLDQFNSLSTEGFTFFHNCFNDFQSVDLFELVTTVKELVPVKSTVSSLN